MLIQFTLQNHRSIRDHAVISFAASKDPSLASCLIHPDHKRALLPVLAIYGANAAGKTNVLHGLMTMQNMIAGPLSRLSRGQKLPWEPFAGNHRPTSFEAVYIYNGIPYAYGFSFDAAHICNEYLYHWPKGRKALIFSRENGNYKFGNNQGEQTALSRRTLENRLYLVSSSSWNLPQTEAACQWFLEKVRAMAKQPAISSETVSEITREDGLKARILKEILLSDLGISHVSVPFISRKNEDAIITTTHPILDENGNRDYFQLRMEQESAGTQRFFAQIGGWLQALDGGALLIVDEMERSFHPLLARHLIEMFQDSAVNTKGAQLLFTAHDTCFLDLDFLRRDQIWFAEKNENSCATQLYPLSSFSPVKGENIRREYLQGRFGAIPFLGRRP